MRRRGSILRFLSLGILFGAFVLTAWQLVVFSRIRSYLPAGLAVAGVPVGGLNSAQAAQRVVAMYSTPLELRYNDAQILLYPTMIDFQLKTESMMTVARMERSQKQFWQDFWDYLWGRTTFPTEVPIDATYSEARLRAFLSDVAARYDQPAIPSMPAPGGASFEPGKPGSALNIDGALPLIEAGLYSLDDRSIDLPLQSVQPGKPVFQNLEVIIKQTIQSSGFDGLTGVFLKDLQTANEIHFAYRQGEEVPVTPDIAFTASSIIKVPIMVAAMRRFSESVDEETLKLLGDMIDKSGNEAADWLMDRVMTKGRAPLEVSEDMKALGLNNTFLAGYFTFGSPLLAIIETPANQRTDINTDPDQYSQTTPADIGMLLEDIYLCAQNGGGALPAVFPGKFNQQTCQEMIDYLVKNRLPMLLTAGLPEGTRIAHKHGWTSVNEVIKTVEDAGIIYTPGGNYVLVVFIYHPEQIMWDNDSAMISNIATNVYDFYNLP